MPRAPRWTICVLLQGKTARVDCDAHGTVSHIDVFRPTTVIGAEFLAGALAVRRPGRELLLVHDGVWTQTVGIAAAAAAGLDARQLAQALAFETEPTSNLPAPSVCVGLRDLGVAANGERTFWVVQVRQEWVEQAAAVAAQHGARVAGWLHPIGLGLAGADLAEAARVEVGEQVTFCGSLAHPERVVAARAGQRYWQQAVTDWLQGCSAGRVLWGGVVRPPEAVAASCDDRGPLPPACGAEAADAWLRALPGALLPEPGSSVPVAVPLRVRWQPSPRWVAFALAMLAVAGVWHDDARLRAEAARLVERVDAVKVATQSARSTVEAQQRQQATAATAASENRSRSAELANLEEQWQRQRRAIVDLLRAVAAEKPVGLQVEALESTTGGGLRVQGLAVDAAVVDRFAARLAEPVRGIGGSVLPAESHRRDIGGHDVFAFTIVVARVVAPPSPAIVPKRRSS